VIGGLDLFVNRVPGRTRTGQRQDHLEGIRLALHAERAGYSGIFVTEHSKAVGGSTPSALLEALAMGLRTDRIQVGTAGIIGPIRHPGGLAEEIAQADIALGPNRLVAGIVKGFQPAVFADRGQPMATNADYIAYLDALVANLTALGCGVPVWATGPAAAAKHLGLMCNPYGRGSWDAVVGDIAAFTSATGAAADVFAHVIVFVDECRAQARELGARVADAYLAAHGGGETAADLMAAGLVVVGTPCEVATRLQGFLDAGVTRLGVNPLLGYQPVDAVLRVIDLLAAEVAPRLRAAGR